MSSYPPPPPLNNQSQPSAHPSLPLKPPAPNKSSAGAGKGFAPTFGFKPRSVASTNPTSSSSSWSQSYAPTISAGPAPPSAYSAPTTSHNPQTSYGQAQYYAQPSQNYYAQQPQSTPSIPTNPFPAPGSGAGRGQDYDPELDAQIAQWQSAYVAKDETKPTGNANHTPIGNRPSGNIDVGNATAPESGVAAIVAGTDGKQKTVVRSGGGKSWQDSSLLEWDPSHPRLFIGNLAGEVTDDSLLKAFSRYPSVQKARVIRDKRTSKSKGYGFVSFTSSDDYFQAAKEMQNKYIGSHPIQVKRSTTEIKASNPHQKGKPGKGSSGGGLHKGATPGAGVNKKQPKKKGGMKFLG